MLDVSLRYDATRSMDIVVGGPARLDKASMHLETPDGEVMEFKRFDHVLVRICVVQSRYRFNEYKFVLLGKSGGTSSSAIAPSKAAMIEARYKQGKIQAQLKYDDSLEKAFGQSKAKKSIYEMFQRFSELSLVVDDDAANNEIISSVR